jgi:hypothetical protein
MRRFLRKVKLWKSDLTVSSVEDQAAYALDTTNEVASGAIPDIFKIQEVTKNGTNVSRSGYYLRSSDQYLVFESSYVPPEDDTDDMTVKVVMKPAFDGVDFPQWIVEKYLDAIVGGALDYLLRTPSKPYTNPAGSRLYNIEYKRGIVQARADLDSEGTERDGDYVSSDKNNGSITA